LSVMVSSKVSAVISSVAMQVLLDANGLLMGAVRDSHSLNRPRPAAIPHRAASVGNRGGFKSAMCERTMEGVALLDRNEPAHRNRHIDDVVPLETILEILDCPLNPRPARVGQVQR
jgi:hypothetical protein